MSSLRKNGNGKRGGGGLSRYERQMGKRSSSSSSSNNNNSNNRDESGAGIEEANLIQQRRAQAEALDNMYGYDRFDRDSNSSSSSSSSSSKSRRGWVFNMVDVTVEVSGSERAGLKLYCLDSDGSRRFHSVVLHDPYFYVVADDCLEEENSLQWENLQSALLYEYEARGLIEVQKLQKLDLDQANHLSPHHRHGKPMLKLIFHSVSHLVDVRDHILRHYLRNSNSSSNSNASSPLNWITDLREHDVPYLVRVCTDLQIRAGTWYTVQPNEDDCGVTLSEPDSEKVANPTFLAFDIECTKAPLKFPDAKVDSIYMISYMVNGQGYLILSRDVVSQDVQDFDYTPKPQYEGPFHIFNEPTELALIRKFIQHFQQLKPQIVVTYNGDFFDFPFLFQRAQHYNIDIANQLGIRKAGKANEEAPYRGSCCVHLDAFLWVKRDSYLPQGAQGLKAVTKYKLGYDPVEVDPEDMLQFAQKRPTHMATYSVSDAVATYYLYQKYVHMFIFSLSTIIPMGPQDVLRKGSGTLCEALLMVQACTKNIICPNKHKDPLTQFHHGHLLESQTYIGGKVECLETGVYRSDIQYQFQLQPTAFQSLIDNIDRDLTFAIEVEGGIDRSRVTNYDQIRCQIIEKLEMLRDRPNRTEKPFVYHLDVGAMYPNIILTNRLQPSAIVDDTTCAACDYNQVKNNCKRKLNWVWRGDYNPATKNEYTHVKEQLSQQPLHTTDNNNNKSFHQLSDKEQASLIATRLKIYAKNAYKKTKVTQEITRSDTVCMRENDFYVDTVRRFTDRRYELKKLTKVWKKKVGSAKDAVTRKEAQDQAVVYDSLQVAHKCILNSFYGYVMRKGARWRSMEMAGIVTKTGSDIITQARKLVEQIGRPLELDTDGIWCILPQSFPDVFQFQLDDGSKLRLEYPCIMLNADVHDNFTNHQYQTLVDPIKGTYETRSECSIFFEVDGPYRCMVLPASTEEGKLLKKRYAVFNFDGSLAELKGFELKRRGELELIKTFQSQVFERFLDGNSLEDCYQSVAAIANHWMDVLDTRGESLETEELVDLISENRSMSRLLEDYGDQKGTSQTTARRLGDFLGAEVIKDKGLNCKFIIAECPHGAPVTERAIPTAIWKAEPAVMKHYLRKWLKNQGMDGDDFDIRNILDWDYYKDRLGKTIQKIITIPAALQKIPNPVPRIPHPNWLQQTVRRLNDRYQQRSITSMFSVVDKVSKATINKVTGGDILDIEDIGGKGNASVGRPIVHSRKRSARKNMTPDRDTQKINVTNEDTHIVEEKKLPDKVKLTSETFQQWLERKKELWSFRDKRKRKRNTNSLKSSIVNNATGEGSAKKTRKTVGSMEGYIRDATQALGEKEWHVVEVREISGSDRGTGPTSSGEFVVWVMVGKSSLQKINMTVPRTFYINCRQEILQRSDNNFNVKKVDRHLPYNQSSKYIYEVSLSENKFRNPIWMKDICVSNTNEILGSEVIESYYEMNTPPLLRALIDLGCVSRVNKQTSEKIGKSYKLQTLKRVDRPSDGEYLNGDKSYKRIFVFESVNSRSKTGLVAVFVMEGGSGEKRAKNETGVDITSPQLSHVGNFKMSCSCHLWIVKPGSQVGKKKKKTADIQNNVSIKASENMFQQLVKQIRENNGDDGDADYSCLSSLSKCTIQNLNFVNTATDAFAGVHEILNAYTKGNNGPTFLVLNTTKPVPHVRKLVPSFNSFPLITLPFPPGASHNQSLSTLPSLNWEPQAVQLCFEAYLYMGVVSFPSRIAYARYGQIPAGNMGQDAVATIYDVNFARQLQKNRALLWASEIPGKPDTGRLSSHVASSDLIQDFSVDNSILDSNGIWGNDDDAISPVVKNPGAYRSICIEIEVQNVAIAALAENVTLSGTLSSTSAKGNNNSLFALTNQNASTGAPLGDEVCTAVAIPVLRSLLLNWMSDAFDNNNPVAEMMLDHFYRLICNEDTLLHDPAIYRVLLSFMKSLFNRLLGEFQRLGSRIVCASFNRIIVATNKTDLSDAKEYIDFVIATLQKRVAIDGASFEGIARLSLLPNNFFSHYLFLDEHNYGGIHFDARSPEDDEESQWSFTMEIFGDEKTEPISIVPTVVSGWNIMHYLPSEISQEYFRMIIGRYSKDVYRKEVQIKKRLKGDNFSIAAPVHDDNDDQSNVKASPSEQLLSFQKKMVSKHFSSYLTRAVAEIMKDGGSAEDFPTLPGSHLQLFNPALEFVKNVLAVLSLDKNVETEVHLLKKSLLTQVGVQEYSKSSEWINPSASFVLPCVHCTACNTSRDVDLCALPLHDEDQDLKWHCEACGAPYDPSYIERRLVDIINQKLIRYQFQDLRCKKTGKIATRSLSRQSDCSERLQTDISEEQMLAHLLILRNLAEFYDLGWLLETIQGVLLNFKIR